MVVLKFNGGADGRKTVALNCKVKMQFFGDVPGNKGAFTARAMLLSDYNEETEKLKALNAARNGIRASFGGPETRVVVGKTYGDGFNSHEISFEPSFRGSAAQNGGSFQRRAVFADGFLE